MPPGGSLVADVYVGPGAAGYESDGGNYEQLAYWALTTAVDMYTHGAATSLLEVTGVNLQGVIGDLLGQEDDWLGSYEIAGTQANGWGVGQYADIALKDERGVECLRLWFTITSPE